MIPASYSMSRKIGWRRYVDDPPRERPRKRTLAELKALDDAARDADAEERKDWHANLGIMTTLQLERAHATLEEVVDSNRQDPDRIRVPAALDAFPGLGKTTIANTFARKFDRAQRARFGTMTVDGHEHIPVFRVTLNASSTLRSLNRAICTFFGHPASRYANADSLGEQALDCVLSCGSRLGIIDDLHFVNPRRRDGSDVSNHLKWLCSEFPVTFIYVGVGLKEKGFLEDGFTRGNAAYAQNARRWTRIGVAPFDIVDDEGRAQWLTLLRSLDSRIVLAEHHKGDLTRLADYIFERSTGHIGSLMSLVVRGCRKAIETRGERITEELLNAVQIDAAAEEARQQVAAAIAAGRLSTKLG